MTGLVRSKLIHLFPEPWADRARVRVPDLDLVVDGLTMRSAQIVAAHATADALGYEVSEVVFEVGTIDSDSGAVIGSRDWVCRAPTGGWNLWDPLERHAFNLRELVAERLVVGRDPGCMLAVPDETGTVHVASAELGYRDSQSAGTFLMAATYAPFFYVPHRHLEQLDPQFFVLPHMLLDRADLVDVLGSDEAVHRALTTCRFGTAMQAEELRTRMEQLWLKRWGA